MKKYFKSNDPKVTDAIKVREADISKVREAAMTFADHFGGKPLFKNDFDEFKVAGLCFNPPKQSKLWTKPDRANAMRQRPRASITKGTAEENVELIALKQEYESKFPLIVSNLLPVLQSIGSSWSDCAFNGGLSMFQHEGYAYVSTGAKLADCMQEILASEFEVAKNTFEAKKGDAA